MSLCANKGDVCKLYRLFIAGHDSNIRSCDSHSGRWTDRHSNYIRALETLAELLQYYEGEIIVLSIVLCNYQNYKAPIHTTVDQRRAAILVMSTSTQFGVSGVKSRMQWCVHTSKWYVVAYRMVTATER